MDHEFVAKIRRVQPRQQVAFSTGHNTQFFSRDGDTIVRYVAESGETVEHVLRDIDELVEGDAPFESSAEDWMDEYLPLLIAVESSINHVRRTDAALKDKTVIAVLERLSSKPDMLLPQELPTAIQKNVRLILSIYRYSRKQVVGCLKRVLRSAKRHHELGGPTGYLDFIRGRF